MDKKKLISAGIDYDEGVRRFGGIPELYEKYLSNLFKDSAFDDLSTALNCNDYERAFRVAHDLKGLSGNLSVNSFYKNIFELVEELRDGNPSQERLQSLIQGTITTYTIAKEAVIK